MIVKVQVPLSSNSPDAPALVYARERTAQWFTPVTLAMVRACGSAGKAYYEAELDEHGQIVLLRQVDAQDF